MKRFKFRLDKVLHIRLIRERIAEAELGRARSKFSIEQERLIEIKRAISDSLTDYGSMLATRFDRYLVMGFQSYLGRLGAERQNQESRLRAALLELSKRQEELLKARQERKALDKLKERQIQEYNHFVLLEEQKILDDMSRTSERR